MINGPAAVRMHGICGAWAVLAVGFLAKEEYVGQAYLNGRLGRIEEMVMKCRCTLALCECVACVWVQMRRWEQTNLSISWCKQHSHRWSDDFPVHVL